MQSRPVTIVSIYLVALALWLGGLVVLGAIVAPTVFRIVPAPASADAMTVVFRRFDMIATGASATALVCEVLLARGRRPNRLDLVRGAIILGAALLAIVEALWLSPAIDALHRAGAIRGLDAPGFELERLHHLAETAAKGELLLLLTGLVLLVRRVVGMSVASPDAPR
jgi:uncharacterized membrane protein